MTDESALTIDGNYSSKYQTKERKTMGRYYRVFAEAKVKDKWVNFNPYIVDLGGKVKLIPLIGYEQSTFYEAYDEMRDFWWYEGYPDDLSAEVNDYLEPDKEIDWFGKILPMRMAFHSMVYTVKYSEVKKRLKKDKRTKYEGYVDKKTKAAHEIGEIQEVYEWLDEQQYKELTPEEQMQYSYYEWDDDLSWYPSFKKIERHISSMQYWFTYNGRADDYTWDDVSISDSDIRLIVICD